MAKSYEEYLKELNERTKKMTYTPIENRVISNNPVRKSKTTSFEYSTPSLSAAKVQLENAMTGYQTQKDILSQNVKNKGIKVNEYSSNKLPTYKTIESNRLNDFNLKKDYSALKNTDATGTKEKENQQLYADYQKTNEFKQQYENVLAARDKLGYSTYEFNRQRVNTEKIGLYDKSLGRFVNGMLNFTDVGPYVRNSKGEYIELPSYQDLKEQKTSESYKNGIGKFVGDAAFQIGKIATSTVLNQVAPGLGSTEYFGSMFRDNYQQAINDGHGSEKALTYSVISTATEFATEKILGGTTKALTGGKASALNQGIANGLSRIMNNRSIINMLSHAGSEATEEFVQEYIDKVTRNIVLDEDNDIFSAETLSDAMYSAAVGGLTGVFGSIGDNSLDIPVNENINNSVNLPITNQNGNTNIIKNSLLSADQNNNLPPVTYKYEKSNNVKIDNFKESATKYFNNSEQTQNFIDNISKIISDKDYNVIFDDKIVNNEGQTVNAQIKTLDNGETEIRINPNSPKSGEFLIMHEVTHAIETNEMKQLVLDYASNHNDFEQALNDLKTIYRTNDVSSEVLADISGQLFGNQEFINNLSLEKPSIFKRIYNSIISLANKLTGNTNEALFIKDLKNKWETAYRNTTNEQTVNNLNNNASFSIQQDENGNNYVNVDTNQNIFEGKSLLEQTKIAKKYILDNFRKNGLIINDDNVNVTSRTANEYTHSKTKVSKNVASSKMKASTELNNLLSIAEYSHSNSDDGRHNIAKDGWDYYKVNFRVGNNNFEGLINIAKNGNQKTLYDITRIKKTSRVGSDNKSTTTNEMSFNDNNITQSKDNVKLPTKYSMQENVDNMQELDNSSFLLEKTAKRYEDLKLTNKIEFFKKENGDIRINLIDSNNNLINQFDLISNDFSVKQLGENLGNYIFNQATDDYKTINIGNDINNLGNETDYFMNHRPNEEGATSDNLTSQDIETPGPIDLYEHPEYYFQMDEEYSKESMEVLKKVKGKPNATVTIYRATIGNKINPGDWITLSKKYAEYHNNSQFNGKANVLEMKVKAKDVRWAMDDINEFGYFPNTNNVKNSISNGSAWQQYLGKNYKPSGTRTNMNDIKIPTSKDINRINMPPVETTQNNNVLNPNEISQLTQEDANTTPNLPTKNRNKINDGDSKFFDNINNKVNILNEEQKLRILSNDEVKYYDKVTNKESLDKAFERLNNNGKSESLKWFNKDSTNADSTDVAEGWILMKQYADSGNYDGMVEVAKKMRDIGSKAGQTVQAFNIMERMTPEGMVKYAQSELQEAYDKMVKNKSKDWIDKYRNDFDLKPDEVQFIMDNMKEVSTMEDGYDKRVKLAEIQKIMTDKLPPEKGSGIKSWMRISMLFNPKTQVRNVVGNAIIMPVNSFSDLFSNYADKIISKKTGVRTTGKTNIKAILKGMKEGAYQATNDYKKGINTKDMEGNRFEISEGKSFNDEKLMGRSLNRIEGMLNYVMDAGDRIFSQSSFENSLQNQLILNNTTEITQDMLDIARTESLQRTWNDNNSYTKFVLDIRRMMNKIHLPGVQSYGLGDILIPFAKTPANLTKAIVDYSPLGLVNTLVEGNNLKKSLSNGQFTPQMQHKFVQDLGKATAGTMLYVLGIGLAKAGIVSGESDDDKDTANFIKNTLGISSYSIKIGNKSFTYDWAQPIAAPLSITANVVNSKKNKELALTEAVVGSLDTAGSILMEQSFLQSLNEVLNSNDGVVSGLLNEMLELPSRAVPTFSKQIAELVDDTQRTSFEYNQPLKSALNSIVAKIPIASKTLAPSVDSMGREIKRYGGKNNIFNVFLNPANVNTENISKGAEEIYKIYKATGDTSIMPRVAPYYINSNGEKTILNSEQRAKYQKNAGNIIEENMKLLLKNGDYKKLNNSDKANTIKSIIDYSYNKARKDVLNIEMSNSYNKLNEYIENGGNVADYYLNKEEINYSLQNPEKYSTITQITKYDEYLNYKKEIEQVREKSSDKKSATFNYVESLKLNIPKKAMLIKMYYPSFKTYDKEIIEYVNSQKLSIKEKEDVLKELGFTVKEGRVY